MTENETSEIPQLTRYEDQSTAISYIFQSVYTAVRNTITGLSLHAQMRSIYLMRYGRLVMVQLRFGVILF